MFKMMKIIKNLKSEQFPHSMDKARETVLYQTTLVLIFLVSVNINLIMKLVRKL